MLKFKHDLIVSALCLPCFFALVVAKALLQDVFATHALAMSFVL
jgi:hypothetical protein